MAPERSCTHYFRFTQPATGRRQRSALLERLLARADVPATVSDWRLDAFRVIAPAPASMPGVGAAALYAECGRIDAGSVFLATPVHYVAEMSNVRLAEDGILTFSPPEADALAVDFNRVWHDAEIRLICGRRGDLYCVSDAALDAQTHDPEDVLGRHIDNYLPAGAAAPRLRRLMSEMEMWLFEHAVNRARNAGAVPVVNGLWLWGGGPALSSLPRVEGWTAGDDPLFRVFGERGEEQPGAGGAARLAGVAVGPDVVGRPGVAGAPGVAVAAAVPGTSERQGMDARWLERSFEELRAGRIERLELSAGNRCFSVRGRWNWRPWRRARPWWESFE